MSDTATQPPDLDQAGSDLWTSIKGTYLLRADEDRLLLSACKTVDRLSALEQAHADLGRPFLTRGSMGQDVIHPLIAEMRAQEAHLAGQLAKLKLPDEPGGVRPNQQRDAANSRWAAAHGQTA